MSAVSPLSLLYLGSLQPLDHHDAVIPLSCASATEYAASSRNFLNCSDDRAHTSLAMDSARCSCPTMIRLVSLCFCGVITLSTRPFRYHTKSNFQPKARAKRPFLFTKTKVSASKFLHKYERSELLRSSRQIQTKENRV